MCIKAIDNTKKSGIVLKQTLRGTIYKMYSIVNSIIKCSCIFCNTQKNVGPGEHD